MIWLLPHPLPLSDEKVRPATHRKTEKEKQINLLTGRRGEGGAKSYDEILLLYKLFNILWVETKTKRAGRTRKIPKRMEHF
jgi:hypothetical protein